MTDFSQLFNSFKQTERNHSPNTTRRTITTHIQRTSLCSLNRNHTDVLLNTQGICSNDRAPFMSGVSEIIAQSRNKQTNYVVRLTCLRECFNSVCWQGWGHSRGIGSEQWTPSRQSGRGPWCSLCPSRWIRMRHVIRCLRGDTSTASRFAACLLKIHKSFINYNVNLYYFSIKQYT